MAAITAVRKQIEAASGTAMQVTGDVTHFDEIEAMRQQIEGAFGPVDILVANAGASLTMPGPLEGISEEGWLFKAMPKGQNRELPDQRHDVDNNVLAPLLVEFFSD